MWGIWVIRRIRVILKKEEINGTLYKYIEDIVLNSNKIANNRDSKVKFDGILNNDIPRILKIYTDYRYNLSKHPNIKIGICRVSTNDSVYPAVKANNEVLILPVYSMDNSNRNKEIVKIFFETIDEWMFK